MPDETIERELPTDHDRLYPLHQGSYDIVVTKEDEEWLLDEIDRGYNLSPKIAEMRMHLKNPRRVPSLTIKLDPIGAAWLYGKLRETLIDYCDRPDHVLVDLFQPRVDRLLSNFEVGLKTTFLRDNKRIVIHTLRDK
jgi:hypothetical protein